MAKFKHEGLYILPEGYFFSSWNVDKQKYVSKHLKLHEIETHLNSVVHLGKDVRLKHLLEPLLDSKIFAIIYKRDFWEDMVHELTTQPWKEWIGDDPKAIKDGDSIEYVEVYAHLDYHEKGNKIQQTPSRLYFHGVGYPYITKEQAALTYNKIGDSTPYSLSVSSLNDYMNTPLRIGNMSIYKTTKKYTVEHLVKEANIPLSLGILIHSILWDMSFYGVGTTREAFVESLNN